MVFQQRRQVGRTATVLTRQPWMLAFLAAVLLSGFAEGALDLLHFIINYYSFVFCMFCKIVVD